MDSGSYVYKDSEDDAICLFMFKKLTEEQMKFALPAEESANTKGDYFIAVIRNGLDYIGKSEYNGISRLLNDQNTCDLFSPYKKICNIIPNFTEEEHSKYKKFVESKVQTINQIEKLVNDKYKKNDHEYESYL